MNVEYTGRKIEITPELRAQVERGLRKFTRIAGDSFDTKVVLTVEKHRHAADITLTSPNRRALVGVGKAKDMASAVDGALEHLERQLLKNNARWRNLKRKPKDKSWEAAEEAASLGPGAATGMPRAARKAQPRGPAESAEPHIVQVRDAVALHPMTVEEAVKEAEFRDCHVFVFRDRAGETKVLHRRTDGIVEVIPVAGGL
jgi:putative sigma-54 modulation protein